jgi:uncharacterized protein (TIGR02646 family)
MIRVKREQVDKNNADKKAAIQPSGTWFKKAAEATAKAIKEGASHNVTELYRDDEVRMALERVFLRKCAYCESRLGTVSPEEVEHFRPKGGVTEQPEHPGYYWLAYCWTNLYPACTYCNQKRHNRPHWGGMGTVGPTMGKGTSFPLENESHRASTPEMDLAQEQPLLMDPCSPDVDPEECLRYDVQGQVHPMRPEDVGAQETIRICHLGRRRLRLDREEVLLKTKRFIWILKRLRNRLGSENREVAGLQKLLAEMTQASATYAGAARFVVRDPGAFP